MHTPAESVPHFFYPAPAPPETCTLSLHDALPISRIGGNTRLEVGRSDVIRATDLQGKLDVQGRGSDLDLSRGLRRCRSEEHTSELQSRRDLVCRLLLEKKHKTALPPHIRTIPAMV